MGKDPLKFFFSFITMFVYFFSLLCAILYKLENINSAYNIYIVQV